LSIASLTSIQVIVMSSITTVTIQSKIYLGGTVFREFSILPRA
jgi:hypothetical protein